MDRFPFWAVSMGLILLCSASKAETEQVKQALVRFMSELSPGNISRDAHCGWNLTSDPCIWRGVLCDPILESVSKVVLDHLNLSGILDANSLCLAKNLSVLSLNGNRIEGILPEEISKCTQLTHLFLSGNQISGSLPGSLSQLNNLKRLDISNNAFSGALPDLPRISGLTSFLAQQNFLAGEIPEFNFLNLHEFNVSENRFSGPIPGVNGRFNASSFSGNPELCGKPLPNAC